MYFIYKIRCKKADIMLKAFSASLVRKPATYVETNALPCRLRLCTSIC